MKRNDFGPFRFIFFFCPELAFPGKRLFAELFQVIEQSLAGDVEHGSHFGFRVPLFQ